MANESELKSRKCHSEPQQKIPTPSSPADPSTSNSQAEGLIAAENRDAGFISADADAATLLRQLQATVRDPAFHFSTEGEHLTPYVQATIN
ncbi:MAG: hypothetical protein H6558_05600 [Lewinellaceae bacterium]|nr:hypothetical protein [Lewinellaceae bacterium]